MSEPVKASEGGLVVRDLDGHPLHIREADGYVNATELCKAAGKKWYDYRRSEDATAFLAELSSITGIPVIDLVQSRQGSREAGGGTWVHPDVAVDAARWASPAFAVQVARWVRELLTTGRVQIVPSAVDPVLAAKVADLEAVVGKLVAALDRAPLALQGTNKGPGWTIRDRCRELGWQTSSARQRTKVRKIAGNLIRTLLGEEVEDDQGTNVYYRRQIHLLDKAITIVREEAARAENDRLFAAQV